MSRKAHTLLCRRWLVAAVLALASAQAFAKGGPAPTKSIIDDPDTANAKVHFKKALEAYDKKRYQEALTEFSAANRARPAPDFVYNIARCYDRLERYEEAIHTYRTYVDSKPKDTKSVTEASERIKLLEAKVAARNPRPNDGYMNGDETDVDCGGTKAPRCVTGKLCAKANDCESSTCVAGHCAAWSTSDGKQNGDESDIDCGGAKAPHCADGKTCTAAGDCASAICNDGRCAVPTCKDGVKNGTESDVDCGGSGCSSRCALGKACVRGGNCDTGTCSAHVCVAAPFWKKPWFWGVVGGVVVVGATAGVLGAVVKTDAEQIPPGAAVNF